MQQVKLAVDKLEKSLLENIPAIANMNNEQKEEVSKKIQESIKEARQSPLDTDVWIYRIIVMVLGFAILMTLWGIMFVYSKDSLKVPETLTAIGSGALGALAGLLAPSPRQSNS